MPYLRREHAFGYAVGSLHLAALALGSLLGAAASRRVELAAGRRVLVAAGMGAMGVGALGIAVAPAVAGTLAAALVMGVGGASSLVGAQGALADRHGERRAVALGEANVAASAGQLAVPLLVAGGVAVGVGWQPALVAGALLGAALAWRVTVAGVHDPPAAPAARLAGRLPGSARVALALVFCVVCVEWCFGFWAATYADDHVGLRTGAAVALSALFPAAMLAGRAAGSALARRIAPERLLAAGLALTAAGFPLFWLAEGPSAAGAGLLLVGLGVAGLFPLAVAVTFAAAPGLTSLASGRAALAGSAAVLGAPLLLGRLADAVGLRAAFGVVPLFLVLAAASLALATGRGHPS